MEKPTYCNSCKTNGVECKTYPGLLNGEPPWALCDICAGTQVANLTHPRRNPDPKDVIIAMVQIAHLLRKEFRAAQAEGQGDPL
jgi:hypothetical protein